MASVESKEVEAALQAAEERSGVVGGAFDDFGESEDQGGRVSPDCLIGPCGLDGQGSPGGHSSQYSPGPLNGQGRAEAHDDQGGLDAPGDQGGADAHDHQGGPGADDHHGGPGAPNDQGGPGPQENQGGAGVLDHQEGRGALYDHGGDRGIFRPEVLERVEFAAVGAPNVALAERVSGPGGDAASEAEGRGDRPIILTITVPFESHLEAEMVRLAMDIDIPNNHQAVQKEFRVQGSILAVWIAEDPGPLQDSVNAFFQLLSLLL